MLQAVLVYLIVAIAVVYAALRLMPVGLRASLVARAIGFARRHGLSEQQTRKWQASASKAAGCGSCGPCRACDSARPSTNANS
jgi:hypothetical protein